MTLQEALEWKPAPRCATPSPRTGNICTMAKGHFGPHKVGGPYNTTEIFIIKCTTKCNMHINGDRDGIEWHECIYCGNKIPLDSKWISEGDL